MNPTKHVEINQNLTSSDRIDACCTAPESSRRSWKLQDSNERTVIVYAGSRRLRQTSCFIKSTGQRAFQNNNDYKKSPQK